MIITRSLFAILLGFSSLLVQSADQTSSLLSEARNLVNQFFGSLKTELQSALQEGGPVTAISICKLKAPRLTKEFSSLSGWYLARTSLRLRNQNNHPDEWEQAVLKEFETRKLAGESLSNMEYFEELTIDGKRIFRYMRAIEVVDLCLNCHGENIKPDISRILKQLYPNDQATGFKKGDLRGAFTLATSLQHSNE